MKEMNLLYTGLERTSTELRAERNKLRNELMKETSDRDTKVKSRNSTYPFRLIF